MGSELPSPLAPLFLQLPCSPCRFVSRILVPPDNPELLLSTSGVRAEGGPAALGFHA